MDGLVRLGVYMGGKIAADTARALLDAGIRLKEAAEVQPIAQKSQDQDLAEKPGYEGTFPHLSVFLKLKVSPCTAERPSMGRTGTKTEGSSATSPLG